MLHKNVRIPYSLPDILYFQASFAWHLVTAVVDYPVYLTPDLEVVT